MMHIRSEVFVREDLQAILMAIAFTAATTSGNGPHDAAYRRGFAAALVAVATAVHIDARELAPMSGGLALGGAL